MEKKGGRIRNAASSREFNDFIGRMSMEELAYQGKDWTWTNNWHDEGFIVARLDRFFGSSQWLVEHKGAKVQHIEKQVSDHCIILLDSNPGVQKKGEGLFLTKDWLGKRG